MKQSSRRTLGAIVLLAGLLLPAATARAVEQGAVVEVEGTTTVPVNGQLVAAGRQGETAALSGSGFNANEDISLWMTFWDGSVLDLSAADLSTDGEGAFAADIGLAPEMPTGLHQITARGQSSGKGGITSFYLLPGQGPAPTPGTRLQITPEVPRQLETVEIVGSGWTPGEEIASWLTLPDGAVVSLGKRNATSDGHFSSSLTMPSFLPVGNYVWTARGVTSGATAITHFTLQYGNGLDVPGAALAIHIGQATQGTALQVLASGFTPEEIVYFWLTQPDGAVVALESVWADGDGRLGASFYLSETLPVGQYYVSLLSEETNQASFASFQLEPGPQ